MDITLEEQIEILKNSARGYLMIAIVLKEAGCKSGFLANMKEEVRCFNKALELEETLYALNSCMAA